MKADTSGPMVVAAALVIGPMLALAAGVEPKDLRIDSIELSIQGGSHRIEWFSDDEGRRYRARVHGKIEFTADDRDVESLAAGGTFVFEESGLPTPRRVRITADREGNLERTFYLDGRREEWSEAAAAWLAGALPSFIRESGIGARKRVERILAEGGVDGVLDEIDLIGGDYVHRKYLAILVESVDLAPEQQVRVLRGVERALGSDYETAQLLSDSTWLSLGDAEVREAFYVAVASIESDFERRRTLAPLVGREDLDSAAARGVLDLAGGMDSDYEKASLLVQAARSQGIKDDAMLAYVETAGTIGSSYEKGRALTALLESDGLDGDGLAALLRIAGGIDSDYELASLLARVAKSQRPRDAAADAYLRAVRGIDSDYETWRALAPLIEGGALSKEQLMALFELISDVSSSHERGRLLAGIAPWVGSDSDLRSAYLSAAEALGSDAAYRRAVRALS